MIQLWNFFDGKKTMIAAGFMFAAIFFHQVVVGIWEFNPVWMPKLITTLDWIGMALGGVGFAHKGFKIFQGEINTEEL